MRPPKPWERRNTLVIAHKLRPASASASASASEFTFGAGLCCPFARVLEIVVQYVQYLGDMWGYIGVDNIPEPRPDAARTERSMLLQRCVLRAFGSDFLIL